MAEKRRRIVKLNLTEIEADALLQLAGEADLGTFRCCGDETRVRARNEAAAKRAIRKLAEGGVDRR